MSPYQAIPLPLALCSFRGFPLDCSWARLRRKRLKYARVPTRFVLTDVRRNSTLCPVNSPTFSQHPENHHFFQEGTSNGVSTIGGTHQVLVPIVRLNEFLPDTQQIGQDVVVGQAGWDTVLENNKQSFVAQFVQRPRFTTAFPITLTPAEFVDKLNLNAGNVLSANERAAAIGLLGNAMDTSNTSARGQALRQIAENQKLYDAEFNRAFVLMEYFGYLRRNPNEGQDTDFSGYDFWLQKLNQFSGDFQKSEMVKAFITSGEYRTRFGP